MLFYKLKNNYISILKVNNYLPLNVRLWFRWCAPCGTQSFIARPALRGPGRPSLGASYPVYRTPHGVLPIAVRTALGDGPL